MYNFWFKAQHPFILRCPVLVSNTYILEFTVHALAIFVSMCFRVYMCRCSPLLAPFLSVPSVFASPCNACGSSPSPSCDRCFPTSDHLYQRLARRCLGEQLLIRRHYCLHRCFATQWPTALSRASWYPSTGKALPL